MSAAIWTTVDSPSPYTPGWIRLLRGVRAVPRCGGARQRPVAGATTRGKAPVGRVRRCHAGSALGCSQQWRLTAMALSRAFRDTPPSSTPPPFTRSADMQHRGHTSKTGASVLRRALAPASELLLSSTRLGMPCSSAGPPVRFRGSCAHPLHPRSGLDPSSAVGHHLYGVVGAFKKAITAVALIWDASTVLYRGSGCRSVLRQSSSNRVDGALQSSSQNGVPHFLLYMQYTITTRGECWVGRDAVRTATPCSSSAAYLWFVSWQRAVQ
nr:uncharacterized protein LOC109741627 [Aegilops tauschii subsp. strangulata]